MYKKLIYLTCLSMVLSLALANVADAIPAGLTGWWKCNEGTGDTVKEYSGQNIDGIIYNGDSGGLGPGGSVWVNDPERGWVVSSNGDNSGGVTIEAGTHGPYYQKDDLDGEHNEKKALRKHGIAYYSTTPIKDKTKRRQVEKKRKKGTMFNIL